MQPGVVWILQGFNIGLDAHGFQSPLNLLGVFALGLICGKVDALRASARRQPLLDEPVILHDESRYYNCILHLGHKTINR